MKHLPNPWFLVPALIAAAAGALVGRTIARVSCTIGPDSLEAGTRGCLGWEIGTAIVVAIVAFVGVAVVLTLAFRSLAEWNEARVAGTAPPEPGCETEPAVPDAPAGATDDPVVEKEDS